MTTLREAAQQALEALKMIDNAMPFPVAKHAIKQLSDALAEPETEAETYKRLYELRGKALERPCFHCGYKPKKIYPMEQRTEPERKPMTDEEMKRVCAETFSYDPYVIARAIERAHGIGGEA